MWFPDRKPSAAVLAAGMVPGRGGLALWIAISILELTYGSAWRQSSYHK